MDHWVSHSSEPMMITAHNPMANCCDRVITESWLRIRSTSCLSISMIPALYGSAVKGYTRICWMSR